MNVKLIIILLALIYINCIESTIETNDENNKIGKAKASTNFHFPEVIYLKVIKRFLYKVERLIFINI